MYALRVHGAAHQRHRDVPLMSIIHEYEALQQDCAIMGGALFGFFFVLKKTRPHRRNPSGFIRHSFANAQVVHRERT